MRVCKGVVQHRARGEQNQLLYFGHYLHWAYEPMLNQTPLPPSYCRYFFGGTRVVALMLIFSSLIHSSLGQEPTSGEKFVNVTELHEMPAAQMGKVMNIMSASLGVNCQYCHAGNDFAAEGAGHKDTAREMIAMTLKLNRDHFNSQPVVNCNTCHRGAVRPESAVSFAPHNSHAVSREPPAQTSGQIAVDDVLAKFMEALGGLEKLSSIKSRHITAKRVEPNGRFESEELWQTADGKSHLRTLYGDLPIIEVWDGKSAWKLAGESEIALKLDEIAQISTEAKIAFGLGIKAAFPDLRFQSRTQIDGQEVLELTARGSNGLTERLYFAVQSGLLIRRTSSLPTVLGEFIYQVDYEDYREFDGVKRPTKLRFNMPNVTWERVVTAVKSNVTVDESLFQKR